MGISEGGVTITGIDGGSFMAMQLHVIYSSWIQGAGLMLGGGYGSASTFIHGKLEESGNKVAEYADSYYIGEAIANDEITEEE